jgi:hypothetical protein
MERKRFTFFPLGVFCTSIASFLVTFGFIYTVLPHGALVLKDNRPFWLVIGVVGVCIMAVGLRLIFQGALAIAKATHETRH